MDLFLITAIATATLVVNHRYSIAGSHSG